MRNGNNHRKCVLQDPEWLQNYILLNDKNIIFYVEQKQKDAEAAAHYNIKAAKLEQVIIIFRKFVMEKSIFVISSLLDIHGIFTCSIIAFRAIDCLPPPPVCQHVTFIYCVKYVNTYTGKSFCGHTGGGEGRYAIKLFLIYIYFLVKMQFLPKIKSL